jgi:hypothetical protein
MRCWLSGVAFTMYLPDIQNYYFIPAPMKTQLFTALLLLLLFACTPPPPVFDPEKEKAAIQAVIALETEAYYRQDFDTWRSTYLDDPAFRKFGYWEGYENKVESFNGFEQLKLNKKKQFDANETLWQGSVEERENENFRITPEMAWYTFEQYSYEKDTRKLLGISLETRILEKHKGEWKIAYLGFHYLPDTVVRSTQIQAD